jgi:NADH:ubiquinone oxidoreductase subunit F (NADH-binding)
MEREDWIVDGKAKDYSILRAPSGVDGTPLYHQIPFYGKQLKIALRNCGFIDPDSIEEYVARGGYFSLSKALFEMKPEAIIEEVKAQGFVEGGAGFPTGSKWDSRLRARRSEIYSLHADEGDRVIHGSERSEGDPHSVIEGTIIAPMPLAPMRFIHVRITSRPSSFTANAEVESGSPRRNILGSGFS